MVKWYRAGQSQISELVFSGEGGLYVQGRWNHKGRKVIYCSQSISLCTLEWLSHNGLSVSGFTYSKYSIDIPEKLIRKYEVQDLPIKWNTSPAGDVTRDFSEKKLFNQQKYIAIAVPSVVVPEEYNLIINPLHEKFYDLLKTIKFLGTFTAPKR
ncbi:RES family NAD+ phosphorylase [Legionella sp. CNM-1927-20]|uniref:RES family NAD+ phosphorylase n=1 Tax=Legionella sp. CNM-1927-20 TaxID=3422221 RepID=UPI00403B383F